jgi:flavin reductase (DIM6/NTAB) family NADH-FMN oxidoreductase RutF
VEKLSLILGTELNTTLSDLLKKRINTVIIASIDADCRPHTAPFHYLTVQDNKHLRIAISKFHQTLQNIIQIGDVAVAILDEGDIAVSLKGKARLVKETMDADKNLAIIEIEIDEIHKNNSSDFFVTQGIRIRHKNEASLHYSCQIFQELLQELSMDRL